MKKQGGAYFKIVTIVLAVLLVSYVLFSAVFLSGSNFTTEPAVLCEVGDGLTVSGFVVRSEQIVLTDERLTVCERSEGEWVGGGQSIATAYQSAQARQLRLELSSLRAQLEQLNYAAAGTGDDASLSTQIQNLLVRLSESTAQRDFEEMRAVSEQLRPLVLRSGVDESDSAELSARIAELSARIETLESSAQTETIAVSAPVSGYYSAEADGYETLLTPETILELSPGALEAFEAKKTDERVIGVLSTGQKWYFAAVISEDYAGQCKSRSSLTVSFSAQTLREVKMTVERVSDAENGKCVLVLSCEKHLQEVTALRRQSAELAFRSYEGLRVPKSALYVIDGETGVYILQNRMAKWKPVEILYEYGDDYLVKWDDSSTANLWPQDEIILTNREIENGMVME